MRNMNIIPYDLCEDCVIAYYNDDYSGLDYYLTEEEADERQEVIKAGLNREFGIRSFVGLDADSDDDLSLGDCECCGVEATIVRQYKATFRE